ALEEEADGRHGPREEVVEGPRHGAELERLRGEAHAGQDQHPDQDLHGAGAADQEQQPVDREGDQRDVDDVAHRIEARGQLGEEGGEGAPEVLDHARASRADAGRAARASRSARPTAAARTPPATSWTRIASAPANTATAHTAAVATSRAPTGSPVRRPRKALREGPTRTGLPSAARRRPTCASSTRLSSKRLPNPMPGSTAMRSGATPARSARATQAASSSPTSASTSSKWTSCCMVAGTPRRCPNTRPASASAAA